jgi:hypothetical protein
MAGAKRFRKVGGTGLPPVTVGLQMRVLSLQGGQKGWYFGCITPKKAIRTPRANIPRRVWNWRCRNNWFTCAACLTGTCRTVSLNAGLARPTRTAEWPSPGLARGGWLRESRRVGASALANTTRVLPIGPSVDAPTSRHIEAYVSTGRSTTPVPSLKKGGEP